MRLLIKYPTRERHDLFRATVEHYIAMLYDPSEVRFLFSFDTGDLAMDNDATRAYVSNLSVGNRWRYGPRVNKIEAINRDIQQYDYPWDILLVASDDMLPSVFGYDRLIREAFAEHGPDHMLWINDGRQDRICTIPCMDRAYFGRTGYVYHPSYVSLFADDEETDRARKLGRLIKAPNWITNHSPDWGGSMTRDSLYTQNNRFRRIDERNYNKRRKAGFPT